MKIEINKDYEAEFKKTVWKGLTLRELVTGGAALLASGVTAFFLRSQTGLPVSVCTYMGIPWMLLIGGAGLLNYQGATMKEMLQEMLYTWRTRELSGETNAFRYPKTFTMRPEETEEKTRRKRSGGKRHGNI